MRKAICLAYLLLVHGLLALAVFRPDILDDQRWRSKWLRPEPSRFVATSHRLFRAIDADTAPGKLLLLGDSQFHRMDTSTLSVGAYNFAAGGDTMRNIAHRLSVYDYRRQARAIIVWAGINDLIYGRKAADVSSAFGELLALVPPDVPVLVVSLPPLGRMPYRPDLQEEIERSNAAIGTVCKRNCTLLDIGPALADAQGWLKPEYDSGDGLHLNRAGHSIVSQAINRQVGHLP